MRLRFAITLAIAGVAIAQLSACSSSSTSPSTPTPAPIKHMYVSLSVNVTGSLLIYNTPITAASTPAGTIPNLNSPEELFAERTTGRVFVPIGGGPGTVVNVYTAPLSSASTPAFVLTAATAGVESVTEDAAGNAYVGVTTNNTCCIDVFNAPVSAAASPSYTIAGNGVSPNPLGDPYGMGFDSSGNLYVSSTASILKYVPPFSTLSVPTANVTPNQNNYGLVVDAANNVYVADATADGTIDVFTQPFTNASTRSFGIVIGGTIYGTALDGSGDLWAVDNTGNIWEVVAPITSSSTPVKVLTGVTNAYGIAFGP